MWLLLALYFAILWALPHQTMFLEWRIYVAGVPLNILDALVPLGLILAVLNTSVNPSYMHTRRIHPLLPRIVAGFTLSIAVGVGLGWVSGSELYHIVQAARDQAMVIISVVAGYCLLSNFKSVNCAIYAFLLVGAFCGTMLLTHFTDSAVTMYSKNPNALMTMEYDFNPVIVTTAILVFCVLMGTIRMLPSWLMMALASVTFLGAMSSMHRGVWIMVFAGVLCTALVLPVGKRLAGAFKMGMAVMVLVAAAVVAAVVINMYAQRDLMGMLITRVESAIPGHEIDDPKSGMAWDTRLPGLQAAAEIWATSPIVGRGFGIEGVETARYGDIWGHTPWLNVAAETGLVGVIAYSMVIWGLIIVGRRMALDAQDRTTMLMGVIGLVVGVSDFINGWMSMAWNTGTGGIAMGLIAGMVLRCRAMQLEHNQQEHLAPAAAEPGRWAQPASV
jgi:hypothetical protein